MGFKRWPLGFDSLSIVWRMLRCKTQTLLLQVTLNAFVRHCRRLLGFRRRRRRRRLWKEDPATCHSLFKGLDYPGQWRLPGRRRRCRSKEPTGTDQSESHLWGINNRSDDDNNDNNIVKGRRMRGCANWSISLNVLLLLLLQ